MHDVMTSLRLPSPVTRHNVFVSVQTFGSFKRPDARTNLPPPTSPVLTKPNHIVSINCLQPTIMASFPIGSRVILQGLKKEVFNGKVGVVKSSPKDDRQQIFVDGDTYNLKVSNLRFDEKSSSSLSVKEMKAVLKARGMAEKETTGMTKKELVSLVEEKCADAQERMRIIAEANAPPPSSAASAAAGGMNADTVRSQAGMMANVSATQ